MPLAQTTTTREGRDLVLTSLIDAPREKVYRAWTEPELLKQWFAPRPWTTPEARLDVRAGGSSLVVMRSPEGDDMPCPGVYLEVVRNERLVFTDAYTEAWQPSTRPFMTGVLTFEDAAGRTRYTARLRHWSDETVDQHEQMGFHDGWKQCTEQLAELVARID